MPWYVDIGIKERRDGDGEEEEKREEMEAKEQERRRGRGERVGRVKCVVNEIKGAFLTKGVRGKRLPFVPPLPQSPTRVPSGG